MNALIVLGLAIAGAKFSSLTSNEKDDLKVEPIKPSEEPNGENVYESKDYQKKKNILYEKNKKRVEESKKARQTGEIPANYNRMENDKIDDFSKSDFLLRNYKGNTGETVDDQFSFLGNELKITNNTSNEQKYYEETKNDTSYVEQFNTTTFDNQGEPVAPDGVHESNDASKRLNIERQMALEQGWSSFKKNNNMTYNVTPAEDFKHNNMVPFFRKGSYGSPERDEQMAKVNQQKLELFTGSVNQIGFESKKEVGPLFKPQMGLSNIYGMPTIDGQTRDRYAMALTENRKRQSEIPIEYVRVNKGLNLDYAEHGSDGFHPWFRPLPKTVDELRPADKNKVSLGNIVIPGMRGHKRGIQAPINKNRPERFKEQLTEDILPSYGYLTAQAPRKNFDLKPTLREQQMRAYVGNQYNYDIGQNIPDAMFPKIQTSSRQNTCETGVRNIFKDIGRMRPDTQIGQNERSTTTISDHVGQPNPYNYGFVIDPMDVPDPTIKQQTLYDNAQFAVTGNLQSNYTYDPNDVQKTTLKQLGLYQHSGILGSEYKAGMTYDPNDIPQPTIMDQTIDKVRSGNVIASILGTTQPTDTPKVTTKQQTINNEYIGHVAPINLQYAYDPNDVPRATMKEQTINNKFVNGPSIPTQVGYATGHYEAKTTGRELIENTKYMAGANRESQTGYLTNNYEAKTTRRELIENNNYLTGVNRESQTGYLTNHYEAKTTGREIMENNNYLTGVNRESQTGYLTNPQEAKTTLRQITGKTQHITNANRESQTGYMTNPQEAKTTLRQITGKNKHVINVNRESQTGYLTNPQEAKTTMRQLTGKNQHVINVNRESQTGYMTNLQEAKTTLRQITEKNKHIMNANRESQTGYMTNPQEAKTTMRQITGKNVHFTGVNRESQTGYITNPQEAKTTMRQITGKNIHLTGVNRESQTGYMTNPQEAKTTMRQITGKNVHLTGVNRESQTGYMTNPHEAKTTMRQITGKNIHLTGLNRESQTGYITNPQEAKTTMRQITGKNIHLTGVNRESQTGYMTNDYTSKPTVKQSTLYAYIGQSDGQQTGLGYSTGKYRAKNTARQSTLYSYLGNAESQVPKNSVYLSYYETPIDDKKEIAMSTGRLPTLRKYNMIPDGSLTEYRVKNDRDDMHINKRQPAPTDTSYYHYTQTAPSVHVHQYLPQYNTQNDPAILSQLNMNPFAIQINPTYPSNMVQPINQIITDVPCTNELVSGSVPCTNELVSGSVPCTNELVSGSVPCTIERVSGSVPCTSYGDINYGKNIIT
jgi:hypothetical protein